MGNGLDMRSLEHCLSDLMRGCGDGAGPPDHLKGKQSKDFINPSHRTIETFPQIR